MSVWEAIFGVGKDLAIYQMCARAVLLYGVVLVYVRLAGRRTFGRIAAFDNIITILLGSLLSRGVVGASPLAGVIFGGLTVVLLQRILAWLVRVSLPIRQLVEGEPRPVYAAGRFDEAALRRALLTYEDVEEAVRLAVNRRGLESVDEVVLERSGELSVVEKRRSGETRGRCVSDP